MKVQWQAYLGAGSLLLSDMGRVLLTIVADTSGRHDALCGASNCLRNAAKYGDGAVHGPHPNARDRFAVALAKHGLGRRDVVPNVNFFKGVAVAPDGALRFDDRAVAAGRVRRAPGRAPGDRGGGQHTARARSPARLHGDPAAGLRLDRRRGHTSDPEWTATPEAERAFLQTEEFVSGAEASS